MRISQNLHYLALVCLSQIAIRPVPAADVDAVDRAIERITIADLKRHCGTLASDALEGREAGTTGSRAAAAYLQTELRKIDSLKGATSAGWIQEFGSFQNLIAVLPGSDPVLRNEIILIGAHYDHVGRGNQTNSQGPFGYIHNGADDNASGTAALLELADAFASMTPAPKRTLVFAFWDAEEMGLLGSMHWMKHPTHPLKSIRQVINIDMLGRLRDGKVIVVGWRSAPGLRNRLVRQNPKGDLLYHYEPKVIGDSDHYPFYVAGIPSLHLDTGKHDDYH
ncbi:MAG TPA: M20/M25/M40 family metallo-hydrolase, partial [Schlesneria sp.]